MKKIGVFFIIIGVFSFVLMGLRFSDGKFDDGLKKNFILDSLVGITIGEALDYAKKVGVELEIYYQYSDVVDNDIVISQEIESGSMIFKGEIIKLVVSRGMAPLDVYKKYNVNELGRVPIMMYHGIVDMESNDTNYLGGNVDRDGYNRTSEAFREDLEFYYINGYRMIKLSDYVEGIVDVELGMSPIVLTFDDGNENNFRVLDVEDGNLVIDPNCAVGILEEFKKKYPDYGVTATFFVNRGLFEQEEYNEKILNWLVDNGYDVGNHTMSHVDFTKIDTDATKEEVGGMYKMLDEIIPEKYVSIVALPFGSPYKKSHINYKFILDGDYNDSDYHTKAVLRVGWEAEVSVFDVDFDSGFLKRIRAYDNDGRDFDIEMNFNMLKSNRFISDGDVNTVVVLDRDRERVVFNSNREIIVY